MRNLLQVVGKTTSHSAQVLRALLHRGVTDTHTHRYGDPWKKDEIRGKNRGKKKKPKILHAKFKHLHYNKSPESCFGIFFSPLLSFFFFFFCKSELWLGRNVIWNVTGGPRFAVSLLLPIKGEKERGYIIAIINRANMIFALFGGRQYFSNPTRREGLEMWVISTGLFFFLG